MSGWKRSCTFRHASLFSTLMKWETIDQARYSERVASSSARTKPSHVGGALRSSASTAVFASASSFGSASSAAAGVIAGKSGNSAML